MICTFFFRNSSGEYLLIQKKGADKVGEVIKEYLNRIQKSNLFLNLNIDNIYFVYNAKRIFPYDYEKKIYEFFQHKISISIFVYNNYSKINYEIIETIKDNIFASVYKVKLVNKNDGDKYYAVKKIFKDKIKKEMKLSKCKEITEEDFKPEIIKFNKEIENMKKCYCENSVEIIDYYDNENEFIIIMELCDDTLFDALCKTEKGFSVEEIRQILLELNNVFKRMNKFNISHRDIKLNNILIKYLNKEKTKFKILLSDYGVSNHLNSITQNYSTHAGTSLIMAPEILNDEKYNNKCDLWSLGVIIYQLYTKEYPYHAPVEKGILNQINKKGKTVLNVIEDKQLKDLLSKLLKKNPKKRISWEEYFNHPFFGGKGQKINKESDNCNIF